jgi:hypothetical protein
MINVISVGDAKRFTDYLFENHKDNYDLLHVGRERVEYKFMDVSSIKDSHESYESEFLELVEDMPEMSGETVVCAVTSDNMSGLVLVLLERLRSSFKRVDVHLILRESRIADYESILIEKFNKGVLSNVTKGVTPLIDNLFVSSIDRKIGGTYSIDGQMDYIARSFHLVNVFSFNKPDFVKSNIKDVDSRFVFRANELSNVRTFCENLMLGEKKSDNMFFSLDNLTAISYYISVADDEALEKKVEEINRALSSVQNDIFYSFYIYILGKEANIEIVSTDRVLEEAER